MKGDKKIPIYLDKKYICSAVIMDITYDSSRGFGNMIEKVELYSSKEIKEEQ